MLVDSGYGQLITGSYLPGSLCKLGLVTLVQHRELESYEVKLGILILHSIEIVAHGTANTSAGKHTGLASNNFGFHGFCIIGRKIRVKQSFFIPAPKQCQGVLIDRLCRSISHFPIL